MHASRIRLFGVIAVAPLWLFCRPVDAQFGLYNLPQDDFRWNWGTGLRAEEPRGMADIEVSGSESIFRCDFAAHIRPSSSMTATEIRQIENDLRTRLDFIYAVAESMNYLEQNRHIEWAVLDCKKPEPEVVDATESAARQDEAREKMRRELERRRVRQRADE